MDRKDGGPAFPHDNQELGDRHRIAQPGMSLRDYFAGQAIVGIMRAMVAIDEECDPDRVPGAVAAAAYEIADAMLADRNGEAD